MPRPAKCGTDGGYYRHLRTTRTPPCDACLEAHAVSQRTRKPLHDLTCRICDIEFTTTDLRRVTCGASACRAENKRQRRNVLPPDPFALVGGRWVPQRGIQVWEAA